MFTSLSERIVLYNLASHAFPLKNASQAPSSHIINVFVVTFNPVFVNTSGALLLILIVIVSPLFDSLIKFQELYTNLETVLSQALFE